MKISICDGYTMTYYEKKTKNLNLFPNTMRSMSIHAYPKTLHILHDSIFNKSLNFVLFSTH